MAVALVLEVSNRELTGGGVLLTASKSNRYTFAAVLVDRRSTPQDHTMLDTLQAWFWVLGSIYEIDH